jgi:hypothetical protein
MSRVDHVVLADDGGFKCSHCGAKYAMNQPAPISVFTEACRAFVSDHEFCEKPEGMKCTFCRSKDHEWWEHVKATCIHPWQWLESGDTGLSSKALYTFFTTGRVAYDRFVPEGDAPAPRDPGDFGRCYRLLQTSWAAEWRARIGEMGRFPSWSKLVEQWDELEALYLEEFASGAAPKLYDRMKELRGENY